MHDHPQHVIERLRVGLEPARSAASRVDPARLAATVEPGQLRASAVALVLRSTADDVELLLIHRAEREGDVWSGHVALPGGRAEAEDVGVVATAARETREELAVDLDAPGATLLGALPVLEPRIAQAPRLSVHPFVWHVETALDPVPNEEVAAWRWIPLQYLRSTDNQIEHKLVDPSGVSRTFPGVRIGENVLWGITHSIVTSMLEAIDG